MGLIDFKYQGALFVDAEKILPNASVLTFLIDAFKEMNLLPGTFQEFNASKGVLNTRISMTSEDGLWKIDFGSQRIDIFKSCQDIVGSSSFGSVEEFCDDVVKIAEIIFKKFDLKANRLSLVTSTLLGDISDREILKIFNMFINPIETYQKAELSDWQLRMVTKIEKQFGKSSELINFISELRRVGVNGKFGQFNSVEIKIDINTIPNKQIFRFNIEEIKGYYQQVQVWESEIKEEFSKKIY